METKMYNNQNWNVKDLDSQKESVSGLVEEYFKDPNCYPSLWIMDSNISELEKAAFIHFVKEDSRYGDDKMRMEYQAADEEDYENRTGSYTHLEENDDYPGADGVSFDDYMKAVNGEYDDPTEDDLKEYGDISLNEE